MVFSPNDKDQASDEKSMFIFTEMESEFQPLLYQQVEEPKGVRCISGVTSYLRGADRGDNQDPVTQVSWQNLK